MAGRKLRKRMGRAHFFPSSFLLVSNGRNAFGLGSPGPAPRAPRPRRRRGPRRPRRTPTTSTGTASWTSTRLPTEGPGPASLRSVFLLFSHFLLRLQQVRSKERLRSSFQSYPFTKKGHLQAEVRHAKASGSGSPSQWSSRRAPEGTRCHRGPFAAPEPLRRLTATLHGRVPKAE